MRWYQVVKTINGYRYRYLQRTYRVGKEVKTENLYLGPYGPRLDREVREIVEKHIGYKIPRLPPKRKKGR